jgi:hypothetical protein
MTASLRQVKHAETVSANNISVVLDSVPVAGNLLVAVVNATANVTTPVHPWSGTPDVSGGATNSQTWITSKIAGASESTTVSFSNGLTRGLTIDVYEFAATPGRTWLGLDKSATSVGSLVSTLAIGPTAAQAEIDDVAVAGCSLGGTAGTGVVGTLSDGYTVPAATTSAARGWSGHKLLPDNSATQTTGNWVTARNAAGSLATYKQTGTPTPPATSVGTGFFGLI